MMEREELSALMTQRRPLGARASVRGLLPTGISARRARVVASRALTLSLSGFTTQTRSLPVLRFSKRMGVEPVGGRAVSGACTICVNDWVRVRPLSSVAVRVTV